MIGSSVFALTLAAVLEPPQSAAPVAAPVSTVPSRSAAESTAADPRPVGPPPVVPRYRGTGLFVGAGLISVGALSLSAIAATQPCDHYEDCLLFTPPFSYPAAIASLAAVPFAVFGARRRARYDLAVGAASHARGLSIAGAVLLGFGVAGSAALRALTPRVPCGKESDEDYACFERWNPAMIMGAYGAEVVATAGAGMLSYGVTSKRGRQLSLQPAVSASHWGLHLTARW